MDDLHAKVAYLGAIGGQACEVAPGNLVGPKIQMVVREGTAVGPS
jgi:hypothetical protein